MLTDTIYIVQEGWHTGMVIKTKNIPKHQWPVNTRFLQNKYIDISWGDEKYYQAPGASILLAARAIVFPTRSVIRIVGVDDPLRDFYAGYTIMPIAMDSMHFQALLQFVFNSFKRNRNGKIIPSSVYYPSDIFFVAKRPYHFFRTCNTWIALGLKKSGKNISNALLISKSQLFNRLEKLENTWYIRDE